MRKFRILHIAATNTGGVGLNILLLSRYLNKERFEVSVATALGAPLDEVFLREGIRIYPIRMARQPHRLVNILGLYQLWRLIGREKFDIIHTHTSVGGFLGRIAARARRVPVVLWSIHGWAFNYPIGYIQKRLIYTIEKVLDYFTDHYVAVSRNMKEIGICAGIAATEKVSVIYNGIEVNQYTPQGDSKKLREKLGISEGISAIGIIGRIEPQKAVDDFLRAAKIVRNNISNVRFLVVGDGPLRYEMERLSTELGIEDAVLFTGWQNNVKEYIMVIDILCISSLWEALPFLLLEAMAMGKPVVASHVGGIPEVVEDNKTGILVPPSRPDLSADAIIRLINDRTTAKEMGAAGKRRVQQMFSTTQMVANYEKLYLNLLGER